MFAAVVAASGLTEFPQYAYLNPSGSQYFNDGEGYRTYISSRTDIHPEGYVEYRISRPRDPRRATSFIRNAAAQRAAKVTAAIELELERLSRGREPASPEHRQAADDQSSASRERIAELELGGNTGSVPVSCVGSIRPSSEDDDSASEERFELLDGADAATSSGATETESEVVRQVTGIDDDIGLVLPLAQAAEAQDGSANANANNAGADARVRELESEVDVLRRRLEEVELQLARATSPR
jgi:hypothetical protein